MDYRQTSAGFPFWHDAGLPKDHPDLPVVHPLLTLRKESVMAMFESQGRIEDGGEVRAHKSQMIPLADAVKYGAANEDGTPNVAYVYADAAPVAVVESAEKPLAKYTKDELIALAEAEGVDLTDATNNEKRVAAIEAARVAKAAAPVAVVE